jgi:putative transposase
MSFLEAKWFYNFVISQNNIFDSSIRKSNTVIVKKADTLEDRNIKYISAQMKTGLHERICSAIKMLSTKKKKGKVKEVGRLKYTKEVNSIELKQYGMTWKFDKTRIKIQNVKKPFKVEGYNQIPKDCEFANAKLVRRPSGHYIQITTFVNKSKRENTRKKVGLDFGIKDSIVTSDGEKFNIKISESNRLKRLQLFFSKKTKGSHKRYKLLNKIKKEYEMISNQKKDKVNKIVSYLKSNYDEIYIQDEQIANWSKGLFGKAVQHSALGAIKAKLKNLESTYVIDKWQPTTKLCPSCGAKNKISLSERTYACECGYTEDRDIYSAKNILLIGQRKFNSGMERISTILEGETTAKLNFSNFVSHNSLKGEAQGFILG